MIVRILEDGQYAIDEHDVAELERLDAVLEAALEAHDAPRFHDTLHELVAAVRAVGTKLGPDELIASDLALPSEQMSIDEVRALLASEERPS